jgi:hypothetical protein
MNCPDVNDLIDLWHGHITDPEMEAHAETCSECQENLALFEAIREVYTCPETEVSEELIQKTLAGLDRVIAEEEKRSLRWNTLGSAVLGGLTVAAAVIVTSGGLSPTLVPLGLVAGTMAGLAQFKWPGEWKLGPS